MDLDIGVLRATLGNLILENIALQSALKKATEDAKAAEKPADPKPE